MSFLINSFTSFVIGIVAFSFCLFINPSFVQASSLLPQTESYEALVNFSTKYCTNLEKGIGVKKAAAIINLEVTKSIGPTTGAAILVNMKEAPHVKPMAIIKRIFIKKLFTYL